MPRTAVSRRACAWPALYRRLTAPTCAFDCGTLCAPSNGGTPACCDNEECEPVLFADELRWLRSRTALWRKRPARTARQRRADAEIEEYIVYAVCTGVGACERPHRSLTCRFFPFEPYIDESGAFTGLTYVYRCERICPLISRGVRAINQRYVNQSIAVWDELFAAYPDEYELYADESAKLRRRFRRSGRRIALFRRGPAGRRGWA